MARLLAEDAAETERIGDLTPRNVAAMSESGMFSLFTPGVINGRDSGLRTAVEVLAVLGRGCGSSGWVAAILSAGCAMVSLLDQEVRAEVWGDDPHATVASVTSMGGTSERVPGGWRVSGRWQPASGIRHSQWVLVGVPVADDQALALLPVDHTTTVPTWSMAGLQGTGSDTVVAQNLFVPERRILSLSRIMTAGYAQDRPDEPFATIPFGPLMATVLAAPLLGMAEAAVAHAVDAVRARGGIAGTDQPRAARSPTVQVNVATAVSLVDSARLHVERAVRDITAALRDGGGLNAVTAARIMADAGVVSVNARRAVGLFLDVTGVGVFATTNPLQRIWRDVEVACRHQLFTADNSRERYGRALLGIED